MQMLVLAGGFGTRLRSVVSDVPKVLAPIDGLPFLQLQLENWVGQGQRDIVFLLHHQADQIIAFVEAARATILRGCQVQYVVEETPLDTGGAIALAVQRLALKQDFLVTNADTWIGAGIVKMGGSTQPAMAIVRTTDLGRYGEVHFDDAYYVTDFAEKGAGKNGGWINAGLYRFPAALFQVWDGLPFSLERGLFPRLAANHELVAVQLDTEFMDIGVPEDYHKFSEWVKTGRQADLCS